MVHLFLFNGRLACGASGGDGSNFILLVTCDACRSWHDANAFAKSVLPTAMFDYEETDAFDEANDDMNARIVGEDRERRNG
jgi:hypothetical protein